MTRPTGSPMIKVADRCRRPELPRQLGPKRRRRLTLMLRAVLYALRGGFLVRPLAIALVLGATGMLFSEFEEAFPPLDAWVPAGAVSLALGSAGSSGDPGGHRARRS